MATRTLSIMRIQLAVGAAALLTVSACGAEDPDNASETSATPAETVTVTSEPDPESEPKTAKTNKPKPTKKASQPSADGVDTFEMPDETGNDLQFAQDHLQSITDNFLFYSSSEDATGAGRFQMLDSGWIVCSQTPQPGAIFDYDTDIIFYVVKEGEACP